MAVTFVFMAILPPNSLDLHPVDQRVIRQRGPGALFPRRSFITSSSKAPQLPLELDAEIWIHLLSNRMLEYQSGAIECVPVPEKLNPRPHPDDTCGASSSRSRRRDPEDPDDPEAQRGTKRPFLPDSNTDHIGLTDGPENQSGAGGANQGHVCQQVDLSSIDQRGSELAAEIERYTPQKVIFDLPREQVGFLSFSMKDLFGNLRGDNQGIPLGLTPPPKENTSSGTKPRNMVCYEVFIKHDESRIIHDELRR
jgi:hypothetical protein